MRIRPVRLVSSVALIATLVAMVVLTFGVATRRWQAVPVLSGSMEPAIEAGALAFSVATDRDDLAAGDVIVFRAPRGARAVTVHRVETVTAEPRRALLTTKGDANSVSDPWGEFAITEPQVWKVTGSLAGLGKVVLWARTPTAQLIGFVALVVCAAIFLSDWRMTRRRREWDRRYGERLARGEAEEEQHVPTHAPVEAQAETEENRESLPTARTAIVPAASVRATVAALASDDEPADAITAVQRGLDAIDPTWRWEPFATETDGSPVFERDEHGQPQAFWLRLHVAQTCRTGMATRREEPSDVRQELVVDALRFAAAGLESRTVVIPDSRSASKPRVGRSGAVLTSLILPVLLFGVGPGANATFTDRASDSITVATRDVAPPQLTSAEVAAVLGSCEVTLTWTPSPTVGVDGYVFDRQPIAIGTAETDALGLTSPDPTGPWETVLRVEDGSTVTAVDTLPEEELQAASRFRYRSRATIGSWESANSNVVEAQALGACLDPDLAGGTGPVTDGGAPLGDQTEPVVDQGDPVAGTGETVTTASEPVEAGADLVP